MTLFHWDMTVKPHLQFIEAGAAMAARHARALPIKPEFQTMAQDQLAETRKILESALASIIAAEIIYETKALENAA